MAAAEESKLKNGKPVDTGKVFEKALRTASKIKL
jgi:hypothetical protein